MTQSVALEGQPTLPLNLDNEVLIAPTHRRPDGLQGSQASVERSVPITAAEIDDCANKLGNYTLAHIELGLQDPFPGTKELPVDRDGVDRSRTRKPSGYIRSTEPGAADRNLIMGYGMTEWVTPEQAATNARGRALVREEEAKLKENQTKMSSTDVS